MLKNMVYIFDNSMKFYYHEEMIKNDILLRFHMFSVKNILL